MFVFVFLSPGLHKKLKHHFGQLFFHCTYTHFSYRCICTLFHFLLNRNRNIVYKMADTSELPTWKETNVNKYDTTAVDNI